MFQISEDRIDLCEIIAEEAIALGMGCFVVGGVVRDLLRDTSVHDNDIDCIVVGSAAELGGRIAARVGAELTTFDKFLTAKVTGVGNKTGCDEIDLVTARKETYSAPGALPTVQPGSLKDDLARRDFTINAMALPLAEFSAFARKTIQLEELLMDIHDPFKGQEDLSGQTIRILHPKSFIDDPTRIVRLARYRVRVSGKIEAETQAALDQALGDNVFTTIAAERLWSEMKKALGEEEFVSVVQELDSLGLFRAHPELSTAFQGLSSEAMSVYAREVAGLGIESRLRVLLALVVLSAGDATPQIGPKLGFGKKWIKQVRNSFSGKAEDEMLSPEERSAIEEVRRLL